MKKRPTTEETQEESFTIREAGLPSKLRATRQKLSAKAKQEKRYRFYSLYGVVIEPETLQAAWEQVRFNNGSAGVDGVSIGQIEGEGVESFLGEIGKSLREKTYRAQAVRRVYILKENGKERPLGIPTVRDRVVQTAVKLVLEPIFEADFEECSYGFRPGRSAHDALEEIQFHLRAGCCAVYDADLEGYFDSIPHDKLMAGLRTRVVDGSILKLIEGWLKAPVVESPREGGGKPTIKRNEKGTPQGGVISPLLANIYLHWFDRCFHGKEGPAKWANARLVRYADDFVVLARFISTKLSGYIEEKLEGRLGLKINREKTRIIDSRERGCTLDFLGYSFRYDKDLGGKPWRYWNLMPSRKSLERERRRLHEMMGAKQCWKPLPDLIGELNAHLRGWANYYSQGYPRKAFRDLNEYVRRRLGRHLRRRSQREYRPPKGVSLYAHLQKFGLIRL